MSSDTPRTDAARQDYADYKSGDHRFLVDGKWIEQPNGWEFAAALERELTALRKEREWRPMETAPRDGVPILVAYEDGKIGLAHRFPGFCWYEVVAGKIPIAWLPLPDTHAITGGEG